MPGGPTWDGCYGVLDITPCPRRPSRAECQVASIFECVPLAMAAYPARCCVRWRRSTANQAVTAAVQGPSSLTGAVAEDVQKGQGIHWSTYECRGGPPSVVPDTTGRMTLRTRLAFHMFIHTHTTQPRLLCRLDHLRIRPGGNVCNQRALLCGQHVDGGQLLRIYADAGQRA